MSWWRIYECALPPFFCYVRCLQIFSIIGFCCLFQIVRIVQSMDVTTASEYFISNIISHYVLFIYWMRILCDSILLRCYFNANLPFHFQYYCIMVCSFCVSNIIIGTNIKRTQQEIKIYEVGNSHVFIACLPIKYFFCCMYAYILFCFH